MMTTPGKTTVFCLTMCCLISMAAFADEDGTETVIQQAPCCFENPRFSGTCEVTPGEGESCASILNYLNNPNSMGKGYCGNTNVRGGWTSVACATSVSNLPKCDGEPTAPTE